MSSNVAPSPRGFTSAVGGGVHHHKDSTSGKKEKEGGEKQKSNFGPLYKAWEDEEKRKTGLDVISPPDVFVKVKIYTLGKIDMKDGMCFDIDFAIITDWIDPSIDEETPFNDENHFSPLVSIHNCAEPNPSLLPGGDPNCRKQKTDKGVTPRPGHVKRTQRYKTKISLEDINLEHYPFDSHNLLIKLKGDHLKLTSASIAGEECNPRNLFDNCHHEKENDNKRQEWQIMGFEDDKYTDSEQKKAKDLQSTALSPPRSESFFYEQPKKKKSEQRQDELWVTIKIRRNPYGVIKMLIVPLFVCVALSISSFFLTSDALGDRLSITVTILLAVAAFHQYSQNSTPQNLPYQTILDKYML